MPDCQLSQGVRKCCVEQQEGGKMHARASENIIKKRREEVLTVVHARLRLFCRSIKEPAGRRSIFWQAGSRRASMIGTPGITSPRGRPTRPASKSAPVCLVVVTSGGVASSSSESWANIRPTQNQPFGSRMRVESTARRQRCAWVARRAKHDQIRQLLLTSAPLGPHRSERSGTPFRAEPFGTFRGNGKLRAPRCPLCD